MNKHRHSKLQGIEQLEDRRTMAAGVSESLTLDMDQSLTTSASMAPAASTASATAVITQGGTFNVTDYGVIAGSSAVQTAAIQRVFDLAARSGPGATVRFAPGTYVTDQIDVPDSIGRIIGTGATLKLIPLAGAWARILNVEGTTPGDRPLMTIEGFEFHLNRTQQGWGGGHDLEHQAAIFLAGRRSDADGLDFTKLNVAIKNVYMHDGVGDGIYVYHNVTATITDVRAKDFFRGALMIAGDGANVTATRFKTSGSVLATGLDIEPNNDHEVVNVHLIDSELMGKFDVALTPGSTFTGTNLKTSGTYYLYNGGGKFRVENSTLFVNNEYNIRMGGDSEFTNTKFILTRNGLKHSNPVSIQGVSISWTREGYPSTNQTVVFDNVEFLTDATIRSMDTTVAIETNRSPLESRNWLVMKNSTIDGQFDRGIAFYGGNVRIEGTLINSTVAYVANWSQGYYFNAILSGNQLGSRVATYWSTSYDNLNNKVTHSNATLTSVQNKFFATKHMYRLGANRYTGFRTITGNFDPTLVRTPGMTGDLFVKSSTERWVAVRGDYGTAVWARLSPLQYQVRF